VAATGLGSARTERPGRPQRSWARRGTGPPATEGAQPGPEQGERDDPRAPVPGRQLQTEHHGVGVVGEDAGRHPVTPGVRMQDLLTVSFNAAGTIDHVINGVGAAVTPNRQGPENVVECP
jgi:hypothetical protein